MTSYPSMFKILVRDKGKIDILKIFKIKKKNIENNKNDKYFVLFFTHKPYLISFNCSMLNVFKLHSSFSLVLLSSYINKTMWRHIKTGSDNICSQKNFLCIFFFSRNSRNLKMVAVLYEKFFLFVIFIDIEDKVAQFTSYFFFEICFHFCLTWKKIMFSFNKQSGKFNTVPILKLQASRLSKIALEVNFFIKKEVVKKCY